MLSLKLKKTLFRMSRGRFLLLPIILIVVVVVTYYLMFSSPSNISRSEEGSQKYIYNKKQNAVSWSQKNQGLRPGERRKQVIANRFKNGGLNRMGTLDENKKPFSAVNEMSPVKESPVIARSKGGKEQNQRDTKIPTDVWRITNESRFYGNPSTYIDFFHNKLQRIVHLDLKGAAPNMVYMQQLFGLFNKLGATGVLIEYEDMFPFTGKLAVVAAKNHYSRDHIEQIVKLADQNSLTVIPLVQTFGHMELLLKHEEFRVMREIDDQPFTISPALESSYYIIDMMVGQVLALHPNSRYIHLGSDEVYGLGRKEGLSYKMVQAGKKPDDIFLTHVRTVAKAVRDKHKNVQPIIWDDMFRHLNISTIAASHIANYIEPMVWNYRIDPMENLPKDIWSKYSTVFQGVWTASAFKGATGTAQFLTDATHHLKNNLNWVKIIEKYGPGNKDQENAVPFKGIALTGWQRYDHFANLCELMPAGLPSLAVCLKSIQHGGFNKSLHEEASDMLQCDKLVKLDLKAKYRDSDGCKFPGYELFYLLRKLWGAHTRYEGEKEDIKGRLSRFHLENQFFNPGFLVHINESVVSLKKEYTSMESMFEQRISHLFDRETAREWTRVNIRQVIMDLDDELLRLKNFAKKRTWADRPGYNDRMGKSQNIGQVQNQGQGGVNQYNNRKVNQGQGQDHFRQSHILRQTGQVQNQGQNQGIVNQQSIARVQGQHDQYQTQGQGNRKAGQDQYQRQEQANLRQTGQFQNQGQNQGIVNQQSIARVQGQTQGKGNRKAGQGQYQRQEQANLRQTGQFQNQGQNQGIVNQQSIARGQGQHDQYQTQVQSDRKEQQNLPITQQGQYQRQNQGDKQTGQGQYRKQGQRQVVDRVTVIRGADTKLPGIGKRKVSDENLGQNIDKLKDTSDVEKNKKFQLKGESLQDYRLRVLANSPVSEKAKASGKSEGLTEGNQKLDMKADKSIGGKDDQKESGGTNNKKSISDNMDKKSSIKTVDKDMKERFEQNQKALKKFSTS